MHKATISGLAVFLGAALLATGYWLGQQNAPSEDPQPATVLPPASETENVKAHEGLTMPPAVDPDASFAHFAIGRSNAKSMLMEDNILWVGTSSGVIRYETDKDRYRILDLSSGLLAKGIFFVGRFQDRLAAGTYGGGLALLKGLDEGWDIYNVPDGLADAFIYDMVETRSGDLWIATWSGANLVRGGRLDDPSAWETYTVANTNGGLPNDWVYALSLGVGDEIWMATEGGLARFEDGEWQNWNHKDGLGAPYDEVKSQITFTSDPAKYSEHHARQKVEMDLEGVQVAYNPNYIVALQVDADGIVWCGTWGGGLARFDGSSWKYLTVTDGLPSNHVFMLYRSEKSGTLWVGTSNGLAKLENKQFTRYGTEHGLFSPVVFSMTEADDGSLWVGSFGGVAHIQKLDD
jgi:ligand-binding sensor domain-containing protein